MEALKTLEELLPGFNCGACGCKNCYQFSLKLEQAQKNLSDCPVLNQERFQKNRKILAHKLPSISPAKDRTVIGLIDQVKADFQLHPLPDEPSCRETLACFTSVPLEPNMIIRYRPLGCPIIHFARIIELSNGLLDVWVIGPCQLLSRDEPFTDLGICMVLSFQGEIKGELPKVGQTVKFLPAHCMMGKVHSGIIVSLKDKQTRIDCIDLKVWQHASV